MSASAAAHLFKHVCSLPLAHRPKGVLLLLPTHHFGPSGLFTRVSPAPACRPLAFPIFTFLDVLLPFVHLLK